jgi:hypothetical protein
MAATTLLPATQKKVALEEAIITDLRDSSLTYVVIAVRHGVGVARIAALAKANNLTHARGRKDEAIAAEEAVTEGILKDGHFASVLTEVSNG